MPSKLTRPIGPGTVNRTANLSRELDARLGKAVYRLGAKSRGEIIRVALVRYLKEVGEVTTVITLGLVGVLTIFGAQKIPFRVRGVPRTAVIRQVVRNPRREEAGFYVAA